MNSTRWSLHKFHNLNNARFDILAYSKLKHGSDLSARLLGNEMAIEFYKNNLEFLLQNQVVVIPAPGTMVPVAATLLAKHFVERLNFLLTTDGYNHVEMNYIYRYMSYNMNTYADISADERAKLLQGDILHINESFIKGKNLIFIDDVCITGTHEKKLEHELELRNINERRIYASYAFYNGDDPSIEGRLNKTCVQNPLDIVWLAQESNFTVTVRCLRFMLEASESEVTQILRGLPRRIREEFCAAAIEKGYYKYPEYQNTYKILHDSVI